MDGPSRSSVRDLGHLAWKDSRAWMESMRGPRWRALVAEETNRFQDAVEAAAPPSRRTLLQILLTAELAEERNDAAERLTVKHGGRTFLIVPKSGSTYEWVLSTESAEKGELVGDLEWAEAAPNRVYQTVDRGDGSELYRIDCVELKGSTRHTLWSVKGGRGGVGHEIAILGGRLYYLDAAAPLQYKTLRSVDAKTGKGVETHYHTDVPSVMLALLKGENGCLFLVASDGPRQALFHITESGAVHALSKEGVAFYPVGYAKKGGKEPCYLVRRKRLDAPWSAMGEPLAQWSPTTEMRAAGVEWIALEADLWITREHGERCVYRFSGKGGRAPKLLRCVFGEFSWNPWVVWNRDLGVDKAAPYMSALLTVPGATPTPIKLWNDTLEIRDDPLAVEGDHRLLGWVTSADGTPVRWGACWSSSAQPRALLVCGYGAYGVPTHLNTGRWTAYLKRGWAIGFAFVRGGGDFNEEWADAGRREGKRRSVEDLEACVRALQSVLEIPVERTCLFGRSAGGYLVGAAVARSPKGELAAAAYTEVPYVDVLRTTTNPGLPLTEGEYNEFGDPTRRIAEFQSLLSLSPIDALGPQGAPGVFVVCRTGKEDTQVYPYESFKWIDALRGAQKGGEPKLVSMGSQGHFSRGPAKIQEQTEDFLLLSAKILPFSK
jgi:hypothetical protein